MSIELFGAIFFILLGVVISGIVIYGWGFESMWQSVVLFFESILDFFSDEDNLFGSFLIGIILIVVVSLIAFSVNTDSSARKFAESREETYQYHHYNDKNRELTIKTDKSAYICANNDTNFCVKVGE